MNIVMNFIDFSFLVMAFIAYDRSAKWPLTDRKELAHESQLSETLS